MATTPPPRTLVPALALAFGWALACGSGGATPPSPATDAVPVAASAEPTEPTYAATQVVIAYAGAAQAPAAVTRTEAEAKALADQVWRRAKAGEPIESLARELSDAPSAGRGGIVGTWRTTTMVPAFERAVAAVKVGEVTAPFETPFGWHVVRRDAVVEIAARHLLVAYAGAWRSPSTRTKAEAQARIANAQARLDAGEDFAVVARELSDDGTASVGGDLGTIARGQLVPAVEDAAFALAVGQRSGVVESPYGFHLIERTR